MVLNVCTIASGATVKDDVTIKVRIELKDRFPRCPYYCLLNL